VPLNILLVDDDENILFLFGLALEDNGFEVKTANTGSEALSLCEANNFDLIILDYKLSDIDGLSLASEIRKISTRVKILLVTGNQSMTFTNNKSQNVSKVLLKPVTEDELVSEIHLALGQEVI
jgi:DNA-binding response OmpR family regulator